MTREQIRKAAGWGLVGGLSIAAFTAVVALIVGDFDDTEVRVILTSLGFATASSLAAVGAGQRYRASGALRALGTATAALAAVAFALLVAGLWTGDWGSEGIWRSWGCAALLAVAGSHACVVLGARRSSDTTLVSALVVTSIALAGIDTFGALLPISGLVEDVDDSLEELVQKLFAVSLVLLLLTSLLPPLVRRLQPARERPAEPRSDALGLLTEEVAEIADRIEELARGPGLRTPEIRREAERLRKLARSFGD